MNGYGNIPSSQHMLPMTGLSLLAFVMVALAIVILGVVLKRIAHEN